MRSITYRLKTILKMLLGAKRPVPVKEIAGDLKVSRRTVFRELSNTESILQSFGLSIGTKPGEGIYIDGNDRGKDSLRRMIQNMGGSEPTDRANRQMQLAMVLLLDGKLEKLMKYAETFGVSVATISNDLDEIEPWLKDFGIAVSRCSGSRVSIFGTEMLVRMVILNIIRDAPEILSGLHEEMGGNIAEPGFDKWMTPQSTITFRNYLSVAVYRFRQGRVIDECGCSELFESTAKRLSEFLREKTSVVLPIGEVNAISLVLHGCSINMAVDDIYDDEYERFLRLAHDMIGQYRSEYTWLLQKDETLLEGLVSYLLTAIVRIENRIDLHDILSEQMAAVYPDVLDRAKGVAALLRERYDWLPDCESSLLATHFGAAQSRLDLLLRRKVEVRVGVVCAHGMGTSYLLASQARKSFTDETKFEVGSWTDPEGWRRFDFLISTTPIHQAEIPVVEVSLMLSEEDIANVRLEIQKASRRKLSGGKTTSCSNFARQCESIECLAADVKSLLTAFIVQTVAPGLSFSALADTVAGMFAADSAAREIIVTDIHKREEATPQMLRELSLVFLHAKTSGVINPVFGMVTPNGGVFSAEKLAPARSCIALLVPKDSSRSRLEMAGTISTSLVTNGIFLDHVLNGEAENVRGHLEDILERFLVRYVAEEFDRMTQ